MKQTECGCGISSEAITMNRAIHMYIYLNCELSEFTRHCRLLTVLAQMLLSVQLLVLRLQVVVG
jgi:hypothetical protein